MIVIHLCLTPMALSPARFSHLINKYTSHTSYLIQTKDFFVGKPENFFDCKRLTKRQEIIDTWEKADVFHIHGHRIFDKQRFLGLNLKNKKQILHYHGTPEREMSTRFQRNCKLIVSTPEMMPLFRNASFFPNLIDEKQKIYVKSQQNLNQKIEIAHHYSFHAQKKDTQIFNTIQQPLANKYKFNMISQGSIDDILKQRAMSNIVFDHLQGYYGLISTEGLAQGLCVLNACNDHSMSYLKKFFGFTPPFFVTSKNKIIEDLQKLSFEVILDLAQKGIDFSKNVWSGEKNIKKLIDIYETL